MAYVNYPNITGVRRQSALSFSPPLGFGNLGTAPSHKLNHRHFTDVNIPFLGSNQDRAQRIGTELTLAFHNAMAYSGLRFTSDLDELLNGISYEDEHGQWKSLMGFSKFHPTRDLEQVHQWLGYYRWYYGVCSAFLIYITKEGYKRNKSSTITDISPALLQPPPSVTVVGESDGEDPVKTIKRVVGLEAHDNEVRISYCQYIF